MVEVQTEPQLSGEEFDKFNSWFNYFVKVAKDAMLFEDSVLYAFIGKKRSGKSLTALAMCKMIDPDFSTENIVFSSNDFRKLIKDPKCQNKAILWDESSVTAYTRDFAEVANKLLNKVLQVYGYRKLAICMTFQHLNFLDKHTRQVVDVIFKCEYKRVFKSGVKYQKTFIKPYSVVTDWMRDPIIKPYSVARGNKYWDIGIIPIPGIKELFKIAGVDDKLYKDYKRLKEEFFQEVGEPEKEEEERLQIDKRHLRRLKAYESAFFNLVNYLTKDGMTIKDVAKICGIGDVRLHYWIKNPVVTQIETDTEL